MTSLQDFDQFQISRKTNRATGGVNTRWKFENGYGASMLEGGGGMEIAVLDPNGALCYDTPITDDLIGWLDYDSAAEVLAQIRDLPKAESDG